MSLARARMGVAVLETDLYVIGGFNESISLDSVEQYSSSTDTWSFVQSMNRRRRDPGVGVLNGKIYVIGGYDEEYLDSVEFYDPDTKSWTMVNATNFYVTIQLNNHLFVRSDCCVVNSTSGSSHCGL